MGRGLLSVIAGLAFALPFSARGEASFKEYSEGRFAKALEAVRTELAGELADSSSFMTRIRIATHSFAQDSSIPLKDLLAVYAAAGESAEKYGYSERIKAEQEALVEWFKAEGKAKPEAVLASLKKAISSPRNDLAEIRARSSQLFAIGCLARRRSIMGDRDPEWLYVAAEALQADSKSGADFFEAYLESAKTKKLRYRQEAKTTLEEIRRLED
jgi:hypothetical protein